VPMRKDNQQSIKEVIEQLLKAYRLNDKFQEAEIVTVWERVMDPAIVKRTQNLRLQGKRLYIAVESDPLREELLYLRNQIIQRINKEVGKVVVDEVFIL